MTLDRDGPSYAARNAASSPVTFTIGSHCSSARPGI